MLNLFFRCYARVWWLWTSGTKMILYANQCGKNNFIKRKELVGEQHVRIAGSTLFLILYRYPCNPSDGGTGREEHRIDIIFGNFLYLSNWHFWFVFKSLELGLICWVEGYSTCQNSVLIWGKVLNPFAGLSDIVLARIQFWIYWLPSCDSIGEVSVVRIRRLMWSFLETENCVVDNNNWFLVML